jgi:predicted ATPase
MKIETISIKNFRALADINIQSDNAINVIVGPNGVGKTSLLEAIRLTKAVLSPRYNEETQQVLQSLGATTQQLPFGIGAAFDFRALAGNESKPIEIDLAIRLAAEERQKLKTLTAQLSLALLRVQMGWSDAQSQLALVQFLSSPQGTERLNQVTAKVAESLRDNDSLLPLKLKITREGQFSGSNQFAQLSVAVLENSNPPGKALFTYFPADRALPSGEVAVQLGSADMMAQVTSHIGTPQAKYNRLKQMVIASQIGLKNESKLEEEFELIFQNLLPGRHLDGVTISRNGLISVRVRDESAGRTFDIDSMSSGEKGLILSFLIARRSLSFGGVLLFDEPELHLNQAVCRNILPFLKAHLVTELGLNAFICTHSAEIVAAAYASEDCGLFHLRSGTDASPIYERDQGEVFQVLERLGSSTADVLFWEGTIAVEGEQDSELLSEGFFDLLSHFKVTHLGGRVEVERQISRLQDLELKGHIDKLQGRSCFIFDNDNKPSILQSSKYVKVHQWDRYCLENYLIDDRLLFDVLPEFMTHRDEIGSRGEFSAKLKELAMRQLVPRIAREVYQAREPNNCGWRSADNAVVNYDKCSAELATRIDSLREGLAAFSPERWMREFREGCERKDNEMRPLWESEWKTRCNGKQLFTDVFATWHFRVKQLTVKKAIVRRMRQEKASEWQMMREAIENLVK